MRLKILGIKPSEEAATKNIIRTINALVNMGISLRHETEPGETFELHIDHDVPKTETTLTELPAEDISGEHIEALKHILSAFEVLTDMKLSISWDEVNQSWYVNGDNIDR